jgi:hypothetical protein
VRISDAIGERRLPIFTATQSTLDVTFACFGPGSFAVGTLFSLQPCDGTLSTITVRGQNGITEKLIVHADSHTRWRLVIQARSK